ncbi:MAG: hypothetical protein JJU13_10320 [Balneolaceae bacterium]|nr:hypothetical protein [Balneolaceae bacterium]
MTRRNIWWTIGANVKQFEEGMKKVERGLHNAGRQTMFFGRDMQRTVTVPVMAAGASILALAHKTGQYADRVSDLSDVTGISTDSLQEWDFVARRVGVSTDVISSAFSSLGRRMSQFHRGSGPAVDAAQQLGVEFRNADGSIRNADELLMDLIGSLGEMPADLDRAGIGTALFGRRWEMLAPIIGRGSDSIEKMRAEAQELGLVLSGEALQTANEFREEMVKFSQQMEFAGHRIALEFMPVILDFLPLAEEMIMKVGDAIQVFADLDPEVQRNRIELAALAAAIGPLLVGLSSFLFIGEKVLRLLHVLTAATLKNPFTALAAGVAAVAAHAYIANRRLSRMNDYVSDALNMTITGTAAEIEQLNKAIAKQTELMERVEAQHRTMNVEGTEAAEKQLSTHRDIIQSLIIMRNEAAALQIDEIISDKAVDNTERAAHAMERTARAAERVRFMIEQPEDEIHDPTDDIQEMLNAEFLAQQQEIWRAMIGGAEDFSHRMEDVQEETQKTTRDFTEFANTTIMGLDRLIFQSERLSSVWRSMARQLAVRGMLTLATGGFSEGIRAGLQTVVGINDGIISPRGDIITTHPDDYLIATKDPGRMVSNIQKGGSGSQRVHVTGEFKLKGTDLVLNLEETMQKLL